MAAVELPASPGPAAMQWQVVDFGGTLSGPLGGSDQRINRLGNRWQVGVTMPVMTPEQARQWSAALVQGVRAGVFWKLRQTGTPVGTPGSPLVVGAAQTGTDLDVDALTPAYGWRAGQFITIETGGQMYLHQLSASGVAATDGTATLPLEPPLRVSPADNAEVFIALPYIQGLLVDVPAWSLDVDRLARGFSFSIRETR